MNIWQFQDETGADHGHDNEEEEEEQEKEVSVKGTASSHVMSHDKVRRSHKKRIFCVADEKAK